MSQSSSANRVSKPLSFGQWAKVAVAYLLFSLVIFISAWNFLWWQAWVYSLILIVLGVGPRMLAERRHPGLMADRLKYGRGQEVKAWDRILAPLMAIAISFPLFIVAGLDHRFGWTNDFPLWINWTGLFLVVLGYGFGGRAMIENRYFTSMVRIQFDRGHQVCDSGPYRLVRHPGYAGNLLALFGIVLALNSLWTFIPALFAVVISIIRTALEDQTLQAELSGYRDYAARVRYRLIPGIW